MKINSAQSVFIIIGLFLATLSLGAGLTLVTESQDIRQMAAGSDAVVPSCSIALQSGDIVASFSKNTNKFLSAKEVTRSSVEATNISGGSIPAGTYNVFLESYDDHDGTVYMPGNIHYQLREQWFATLLKSNGSVLTQSGNIDDLPDNQQTIKQQVNGALVLSESVNKVIAEHAHYPADNPESIYPVCAVFRSVSTTAPTPTVTPENVSFAINARVWQGNDCNVASSTPVPTEFSAIIEAVNHIDPPKASVINHEATIGGLKATDTYLFRLYNLAPGWSSVNCSLGPFSITSSSPNVLNFWVKKSPVLPWWRSQIGDIYGFTIASALPSPTDYITETFGDSDPGIFIWGDTYDLNNGKISVNTFMLRAKQKMVLAEDYSYFDGLTRDYSKTNLVGNALPTLLPSLEPYRQATILKKSGSLEVNNNWGSDKKLIVMVDGDLTVTANQLVPTASFLHFIVSGKLRIGPQVTKLEGAYSVDGPIIIEQSDQPFEAVGSMVSFSPLGIVSKRSLPLHDNLTQAATTFTYRPDLVINVPIEVRQKTSSWSEVSN